MQKLPKVLFIDGITKDRLVAERKTSTVSEEIKAKIRYSNVPSRIIYDKDIGTISTYTCWYCDLEYHGVALFNPKVIEAGKITAEGNFNSVRCLLSYIKNYYNGSSDETEATNKAQFLYNYMIKKNLIKETSFEPAPSKYLMQKYDGPLTEAEYKQMLQGDLMETTTPC